MRHGQEQSQDGDEQGNSCDTAGDNPFTTPPTVVDAAAPGSGSESLPKPWHVDAVLCATLVTIVLIVLVPQLGNGIAKTFPVAKIWLGLIPLHVGALGAALLVLRASVPGCQRLWALGLGAVPFPGWRVVIRGGTLVVGVYTVTAVLTIATGAALKVLGYVPEGSPMVTILVGSNDLFLWASAAVAILVIAPVAEEILFRTVLFEALASRRIASAATITALLFSAIHMIPEAIPGLFLLGIVLQKARARASGSLWAPIAIHAGFNAIGFCLLTIYHLSTTSTIAS